ncbi:MAG: MarR family winged helix-turn-helix transcriptional regulator [Candidatus Dormibacteria bacterium]
MTTAAASPRSHPAASGEDLGPSAELERAVTVIVRWASSREVQLETLRRARCELPWGATSLLSRIASCGPVHPSQLAAYYCVDNSTITPQLQRLERAGLLSREPDPTDGRAALVRISPAGQRLRKRLHLARRRILEEVLQDLPVSEQEQLAAAAARLASRLELPRTGSTLLSKETRHPDR